MAREAVFFGANVDDVETLLDDLKSYKNGILYTKHKAEFDRHIDIVSTAKGFDDTSEAKQIKGSAITFINHLRPEIETAYWKKFKDRIHKRISRKQTATSSKPLTPKNILKILDDLLTVLPQKGNRPSKSGVSVILYLIELVIFKESRIKQIKTVIHEASRMQSSDNVPSEVLLKGLLKSIQNLLVPDDHNRFESDEECISALQRVYKYHKGCLDDMEEHLNRIRGERLAHAIGFDYIEPDGDSNLRFYTENDIDNQCNTSEYEDEQDNFDEFDDFDF